MRVYMSRVPKIKYQKQHALHKRALLLSGESDSIQRAHCEQKTDARERERKSTDLCAGHKAHAPKFLPLGVSLKLLLMLQRAWLLFT